MPGIVPLKDLHDHKITSGDPDVRGWDVIAADGRKIGKVEDLLVDTGAGRAHYLDVELDPDPPSNSASPNTAPTPAEAANPGLASAALVTGMAGLGGLNPLAGDVSGEQRMTLENVLTQEPHKGPGRHVLIPVGSARLDPEGDRVLVEGLRGTEAATLPAYQEGPLSEEEEAALRARFGRRTDPREEEDHFYASRRLATGDRRIR